MQNKNVDGAIAELFSDTYYKLLIKFPGYFYQYVNLKYKQHDIEDADDILYITITELNFNTDKKNATVILNKFRENIKNNSVDSINKFIIKHWDFNR